jgi:hypothetical protein
MPADYAVGKISAEIAGTTAMGGYWSRMYDFDFTFSVQTSKNGSDWTDFGMQRGNIVPVLNESAEWEFSGENAVVPTDPFFVNVNMVNNSPKYKSYSSLFSLILQRDPDAETSISEVGEDFVLPVSGTYDLGGRPVGTTAKGVLIEDGKVVLK